MSVILPKQIDLTKIRYSDLKTLKSGAKSVYVNYGNEKLTIQTPALHLPYGVSPPYSDKNDNSQTDENKFLVKVHARVPKLHASLPKPDREFCESNRNLAIAMHPIFYSLQNNNTIPQPGNRVKVKFFTNGQGQYGEYLGILDPKQIAALKAQTSAREAMESPESPVVTNAEVSNPAGGGSNG